MFVQLDDSGADGLIPIASLADDYYDHDERQHCLVGRRKGHVFRLGDRIEVRLVEADAITGGLRLEVLRNGNGSENTASTRGKRGKAGPVKTGRPRKKPKKDSRKARKKK